MQYAVYYARNQQKEVSWMAKIKLHNVNARINESMKIRIMAYAIKHHVSESEVLRMALKKFLQTNVAKAKQTIENHGGRMKNETVSA